MTTSCCGGRCWPCRTRSRPGLRSGGLAARTVAIKVRLADFRTLHRSRTLVGATDVSREIFETAAELFDALAPGDRIRLLGVRAEGLVAASGLARQPALGEREHGWASADRAADAAVARFGTAAIRPASLLGSDKTGHVRRDGDPDRVDWSQMRGPWRAGEHAEASGEGPE